MNSTRLVALVATAAIFGAAVAAWTIDWAQVPTSITIRDLIFATGGAVATLFGVWRGGIARRQEETSRSQRDLDRQRLTNERYQKAAELLGHDNPTVRTAGIYALTYLAAETAEDNDPTYLDIVIDVLRKFGQAEWLSAMDHRMPPSLDTRPRADDEVARRCLAFLEKIRSSESINDASESKQDSLQFELPK